MQNNVGLGRTPGSLCVVTRLAALLAGRSGSLRKAPALAGASL